MALINNLYVFVESEDVDRGLKISNHPTEQGVDLTTIIKRELITLNLSGKIVGEKATDTLNKLVSLHQSGALVKYEGNNIASNFIIRNFKTGHPNTIYGGCSFDMTLKEVRIAKASTSYGITTTGVSQIQINRIGERVYHTFKNGESIWYLGEVVYKSKGLSYEFIIQNNYYVPKIPGDFTTLQVGSKLWVYIV